MNMAQARAVVRLLQDAGHPRTDPMTAQFYTPEEMSEFGEPTIHVDGYEGPDEHGPEMLQLRLYATRSRDRQLYMTPAGVLHVWSSVVIPPEDCQCECPGPPESKIDRSSCPVHGDSTREIDCFRAVRSVGWEIKSGQLTETTTYPYWRLVVREGDPIRDVLAEYRAERAATKAGA